MKAVVEYRVIFSDGTTMHPKILESVDVWNLAAQYAAGTLSKDETRQ